MIPKNHPRAKSLEQRHLIEKGVAKGIVAPTGMIAQGRGEAFDYLIGEKTIPEAKKQIELAAAKLLLAKNPVISVNGNTTALCSKEIVELAKIIPAKIEINLFYRTEKRVKLIQKEFKKLRVEVLGVNPKKKVPNLTSKRALVDENGIWKADVVLVMLEDGDRTEFLKKMKKFVIAIDLNPMSRTPQKADLAIIDNVTRALPLLSKTIKKLKKENKKDLIKKLKKYKNKQLLKETELRIRRGK